MNVAVFCSCSELVSPFLFHEMEELGRGLARAGHAVIFGGTGGGCMGALVRGARESNGRVVGVVPRGTAEEWRPHQDLSECHVVEDLSARKYLMNQLADAFVLFPGGLGTLDEAFTIMALKALDGFAKPIIFYNFMDLWTPLLQALDLLAAQRLIRCDLGQIYVTANDTQTVLRQLTEVRAALPTT